MVALQLRGSPLTMFETRVVYTSEDSSTQEEQLKPLILNLKRIHGKTRTFRIDLLSF